MKKTALFIVIVVSICAFTSNVVSQSINFGPRAGFYLENKDLFLGTQADVSLLNILGVHVIPHMDYIFSEDTKSQWLIGCNATYDVVPLVMGSLYVGGGIGFMRTTINIPEVVNTNPLTFRDKSDSTTDSVVHLISGIRFNVVGKLKPFANARITIGDDTSLVLEGGLHFSIF